MIHMYIVIREILQKKNKPKEFWQQMYSGTKWVLVEGCSCAADNHQ